MTANTGISSAIMGHFEPTKDQSGYGKNTWAFEFEQNTNAVNLNVSISPVPMVVDSTQQSFKSQFDVEDVAQLIQWLVVVKMHMEQKA